LDHFGVVEVPDAQKDRNLETYRCTVDQKRDTNLRILLASRIYLDARDCDLKFAHPVTRIARADQYRSNVVPQRRPSAPAEQVGGFSCFVLRPNARVSLVQRAVVSSLIRFLPVILMIVKEAMTREIGRMSEDYCGQHATDAND
jgi:hypothetical protein